MTTILFDADSIIKLTKAGAKEAVVKNFAAVISLDIKKECVDEALGKADAIIIMHNINKNKIKVVKTEAINASLEKEISGLRLSGGERDIYKLSTQIKYDLISSDDQKFLRLLQTTNRKAITPASVIVLLHKSRKISKEDAQMFLENLRQSISDEEFDLSYDEVNKK